MGVAARSLVGLDWGALLDVPLADVRRQLLIEPAWAASFTPNLRTDASFGDRRPSAA